MSFGDSFEKLCLLMTKNKIWDKENMVEIELEEEEEKRLQETYQ